MTYSQLNELSSAVARKLVDVNVRPGVYVPLAFEKSLWTVVAALGILKAGGAFVPIDPNHPTNRLEKILSDLDAKVLVTSPSFKTRFKDLVEQVVVVNAQTTRLPEFHELDDVQLPEVRPQDPVYVLFTSGSTGRPKGMIHERRSNGLPSCEGSAVLRAYLRRSHLRHIHNPGFRRLCMYTLRGRPNERYSPCH